MRWKERIYVKQRRMVKALISSVLVVLLCCTGAFAASSGTTDITVRVKYGQTEARSMLQLVNAFRTGKDAWYWNEDDKTKTTCKDLSALAYDYELEQMAMLRAAEIALSFSHTRPNGDDWWSAGEDYWTSGENIAAGYQGYREAFRGWQETNEGYMGQGHRRNMLSSDYNRIGIGHVYYNGCHYWVQELAYATEPTTKTAANDRTVNVNTSVSNSSITKKTVTVTPKSLSVELNQRKALPKLTAAIQMEETWPEQDCQIVVTPTWSVADTTVAEIEGQNVLGKAIGTTALNVSVFGVKWSVPVTVTKKQISNCDIALDKTSFLYDGTAKRPEVTVKRGAVILVSGTDYTIAYANNVKPGTASVTIKGKGDYTGTVTKNFTIQKLKNVITAANVTKTSSPKAQTFSIGAKAKGGAKLSYKSNHKSVKVSKNGKVTIAKQFVGKATITITAAATKEYTAATKKVTVTVNPAGTKLTSVKSAKAGEMTAKWSKNTKVSGYQLQYATDSSFKSAKTVTVKKAATTGTTVKKLTKGQKYYVRVRTYKKVGSKTYYSTWSASKNVTIKK